MVIQFDLLANGLLSISISGVDPPIVHVQDEHTFIAKEITFMPITLERAVLYTVGYNEGTSLFLDPNSIEACTYHPLK